MDTKTLTATDVPFSSVVGKAVMLTDQSGAVVAQIGVMVPNVNYPYRETAEAVAAHIITAWNTRTPHPAPVTAREAEPVAWMYRYVDPISGNPIWRYSNELWNGQRPRESQPLYAHPPQPSETVAEAADARLATREDLLAGEILAELTRARAKFPGKNVTFAALVEEVGELATAVFEEGADRVRKEAVQVAVMAMRMILDGDHCFEPWRAEKGLDPLDPALRALKGGE